MTAELPPQGDTSHAGYAPHGDLPGVTVPAAVVPPAADPTAQVPTAQVRSVPAPPVPTAFVPPHHPEPPTGQRPYGHPVAPPQPMVPDQRIWLPGTNGLAVAALTCGVLGIFAPAAIAAIVLGVLALNQLQTRLQKGKGMAVAGIVLATVWLIGITVYLVGEVTPPRAGTGPGAVAGSRFDVPSARTFVEDLEPGDCFTGGLQDTVDIVEVVPCTAPHESQVITVFDLPAGEFPGKDEVIDAAESGCAEKGDPLVTSEAMEQLEPSFFYPDEGLWGDDRSVVCIAEVSSGTTTGSALR